MGCGSARPITVACAQIEVSDDTALACEKIADAMADAAGRGARLVVFPECALGGYYPNEWREGARAPCWEAIEAGLGCVQRLCRRHRVAAVVGALRRAGGRIYNSAFAVGRDGKVLAVYDKIHLTGMRSGRDDAGFFFRGRSLPVFRTDGIGAGMQICMDFRFPEPYRILRRKGASLVCQPTCVSGRSGLWKSGILQAHVVSRAAENEFFVALCNSAGPFQNMPSLIAGPDGDLLACAPLDEETVICAEVDPLRRPRMDILGSLADDLYALEWKGD